MCAPRRLRGCERPGREWKLRAAWPTEDGRRRTPVSAGPRQPALPHGRGHVGAGPACRRRGPPSSRGAVVSTPMKGCHYGAADHDIADKRVWDPADGWRRWNPVPWAWSQMARSLPSWLGERSTQRAECVTSCWARHGSSGSATRFERSQGITADHQQSSQLRSALYKAYGRVVCDLEPGGTPRGARRVLNTSRSTGPGGGRRAPVGSGRRLQGPDLPCSAAAASDEGCEQGQPRALAALG